MAKSMQEVLVEHLRTGITGCRCGWADLGRSHTGHLAQELEVAGYGLVADAKREALEEAADDAALRLAGHSGISITRLRSRAAEMRQG